MSALVFVVVALAAWRATQVVTLDTITAGFRRRMIRRFPYRTVPLYDPNGHEVEGAATRRPHWLVELIHCDACLGWWVAGAAVLVAHFAGLAPSWGMCGLAWPAAAAVGVVLSDLGPQGRPTRGAGKEER